MTTLKFDRPRVPRNSYDAIIDNFVASHAGRSSRKFEVEATRGFVKPKRQRRLPSVRSSGFLLALWWGDAGAFWRHGFVVEIDWAHSRWTHLCRADWRAKQMKNAGAHGVYVQIRPTALRIF